MLGTHASARGRLDAKTNHSWELDALEPSVIAELISSNVDSWRDDERWSASLDRARKERDKMYEIARDL